MPGPSFVGLLFVVIKIQNGYLSGYAPHVVAITCNIKPINHLLHSFLLSSALAYASFILLCLGLYVVRFISMSLKPVCARVFIHPTGISAQLNMSFHCVDFKLFFSEDGQHFVNSFNNIVHISFSLRRTDEEIQEHFFFVEFFCIRTDSLLV